MFLKTLSILTILLASLSAQAQQESYQTNRGAVEQGDRYNMRVNSIKKYLYIKKDFNTLVPQVSFLPGESVRLERNRRFIGNRNLCLSDSGLPLVISLNDETCADVGFSSMTDEDFGPVAAVGFGDLDMITCFSEKTPQGFRLLTNEDKTACQHSGFSSVPYGEEDGYSGDLGEEAVE